MKYKTFIPEMHDETVPGMHRESCTSLIKRILETRFKNVQVDLKTQIVRFETDSSEDEKVRFDLDELFRKELFKHGYTYMELSLDNETKEESKI